jgi:hypothetical protein
MRVRCISARSLDTASTARDSTPNPHFVPSQTIIFRLVPKGYLLSERVMLFSSENLERGDV